MHPTIGYQLVTAQIAERHRQAGRDQLTRAARRARRAAQPAPRPPAPRWSLRALTRHASPARRTA